MLKYSVFFPIAVLLHSFFFYSLFCKYFILSQTNKTCQRPDHVACLRVFTFPSSATTLPSCAQCSRHCGFLKCRNASSPHAHIQNGTKTKRHNCNFRLKIKPQPNLELFSNQVFIRNRKNIDPFSDCAWFLNSVWLRPNTCLWKCFYSNMFQRKTKPCFFSPGFIIIETKLG